MNQRESITRKLLAWVVVNRATAPAGRGGKVVEKTWSVLGAPLTVMVGTPRAGEGGATEGVVDAARIVNWLEVPILNPIVELTKRRK